MAALFKDHVVTTQRSGPAFGASVNGARGNGGRTQYAQACNAEVKLGIVLDIEGRGPCFRTRFDNGIRLGKGRVGGDLDVARNPVSIKVSGRAVEAGQVVLNGPVFLLTCDQQQQRHQGYNSLHTTKVSNYAP